MKAIKNLTTLLAAGAMLLMGACESIEDREILENSFDPDNIELEVVQTADGKGNGLTLKMKTPGVIGYWDYLIDQKYTDEHYVVFPIPGTHTFTYTVTTPYIEGGDPANREVITKSIDVTIDVLDQPLPPAYYDLVGEDLGGKAWVFDRSNSWWYMSDPNNWQGMWWDSGNDAGYADPVDQDGKMVFDLNGGANFTHYTNVADATGTLGKFAFNGNFTKLYITGSEKILGNTPSLGSPTGEYNIAVLEADKMVLTIPGNANCGTCGHVWIFKPQE